MTDYKNQKCTDCHYSQTVDKRSYSEVRCHRKLIYDSFDRMHGIYPIVATIHHDITGLSHDKIAGSCGDFKPRLVVEEPMIPPSINIIIKGGVVQQIFSTIPHANVYIHDLDTEINEGQLYSDVEDQYKIYG